VEYRVNPDIIKTLEILKSNEQVQKGFDFIEADDANTLRQQKELVLVEAPTFQEEERGKVFAEMLKAEGLTEVQTDRHGNVFGYRRGKGIGPIIVVEAHMDTVFPMGSAVEIVEKDGRIYCPGICDDTRGCVAVLATIRAMNAANIETDSDFLFMGTVEEEGMGGLGGMKKFMLDHPEVGGCICIDGSGMEYITYEATGIRTMAVNFHGIGGHAMGAFGHVANPLHAAARAVAKIGDIEVPAEPRTTYAVSNFHAGNDAGIHAIVKDATIKLNFRSNGQKELEELEAKIKKAIDDACQEETERWGKDTITYDYEDYVDVKAGTQDIKAPIVQSVYQVIKEMGAEPIFGQGGSTNASNPIAMGVPAVCIGGGGQAGGVHTIDEWYDNTDAYKAVQVIYLFALLLGGVSGLTKTVLE
jgi:acetylornithine deacetylase/succinyl-diaminopimelate desuccinylase-like protein